MHELIIKQSAFVPRPCVYSSVFPTAPNNIKVNDVCVCVFVQERARILRETFIVIRENKVGK